MILNDNHQYMEGTDSFLSELEKALHNQREYLNTKELPQLKEHFLLYKSIFDGFTNLLLKKGLITEDPYKYDVKISEVEAPSKHPVIESEKLGVINQRLSQFERQLDFLNHFFQFSADLMTLPRIKNITALIRWIDWDNLSESSAEINTQILGGIVDKIKQGTDILSSNLLIDSANKLNTVSKQILNILKKVSAYQREKYKFEVRSNILIPLNITGEEMKEKKDETLVKIKSNFKQRMGEGIPFIKSLILEIIEEETSPQSEKLKKEILTKIEVKKKIKKKREINYKPLLMDSLKILSAAGATLNEALKKIQDNSSLLQNRNITLGEKFRLWLMNLSGKRKNNAVYEIEYFDEQNSMNRKIKIDLIPFLEQGFKEARILFSLGNKMSATFQKLESASEEAILKFLDTHITATRNITEKLDPLNIYFKSELPQNERTSVKGVKLEVSAIKNTLRKAHQKRLEYIARAEEIEQMKKLGIDASIDE